MVIFQITRSGRVEKSQKKKKEKIFFLKDIFPSRFPISGDKKGEKSKWFCFFPSGERENVKEIIKKIKKNYLLWEFF